MVLIFLLPLSTARGRPIEGWKQKKNKITSVSNYFPMNLGSKPKLIFYTSIPFQNAQNHFSKSKTLQAMSNISFELEKEQILPRIQRTWPLTCPSWPAACCGSGPAVWVVLLVVLNPFWNRSGACLPIQQKLWKLIRVTGQRVSFFCWKKIYIHWAFIWFSLWHCIFTLHFGQEGKWEIRYQFRQHSIGTDQGNQTQCLSAEFSKFSNNVFFQT
jgi:hypothetical protein